MAYSEYLEHYGVLGMKWGVRKSDYKSMSKDQRKKQRQKYRQTSEYKAKRTTTIGTILGGPLVGAAVGLYKNRRLNPKQKVSQISKRKITSGKKAVNQILSSETDEQKITRLISEGKMSADWDYLFDQNGKLFMATPPKRN